MRDHRLKVSTWSGQGVESVIRHFDSFRGLASDFVLLGVEILALQPDAMLVRRLHSGSCSGGGEYERTFLVPFVTASDGRIAHIDWFDVDQVEPAFVCLDELSRPEQIR